MRSWSAHVVFNLAWITQWGVRQSRPRALLRIPKALESRMGVKATSLLSSVITKMRDLKAEMLRMVCNEMEVQPVLQEVIGETLNHGANKATNVHLNIHARGFWERQRSAFFDVLVCHPNADSYRDWTPKQINNKHENEKKRQYAERVMEIEQRSRDNFVPRTFPGHRKFDALDTKRKVEPKCVAQWFLGSLQGTPKSAIGQCCFPCP